MLYTFYFTVYVILYSSIAFVFTAAKVDERFIQKIVGHKGQNVTQHFYTHLEIQELINEIDKI